MIDPTYIVLALLMTYYTLGVIGFWHMRNHLDPKLYKDDPLVKDTWLIAGFIGLPLWISAMVMLRRSRKRSG